MGLILWGTWTWVSLCNGYLIMAIKSLTLNLHQWPQVLSKAGRSTAWVKRTHSENPSSGCTLLLSLPFSADPLMIFPYIQHLLQIPVESAWPQYRSRERELGSDKVWMSNWQRLWSTMKNLSSSFFSSSNDFPTSNSLLWSHQSTETTSEWIISRELVERGGLDVGNN